MADATCSNCKHHAGDPVGPDARRQCRAVAPTLGREVHAAGHGPHPVFLAMWPLTLPSDGCGDFEAAEAQPTASDPTPAVAPAAPAVSSEQPRRKGKG